MFVDVSCDIQVQMTSIGDCSPAGWYGAIFPVLHSFPYSMLVISIKDATKLRKERDFCFRNSIGGKQVICEFPVRNIASF